MSCMVWEMQRDDMRKAEQPPPPAGCPAGSMMTSSPQRHETRSGKRSRTESASSHAIASPGPRCVFAFCCAAQIVTKINSYRQQYADNQNISFLTAIVSTSSRIHGEFCAFFFYRPTGRQRRTSLPLECHRNATNRTRSDSSARHSTRR